MPPHGIKCCEMRHLHTCSNIRPQNISHRIMELLFFNSFEFGRTLLDRTRVVTQRNGQSGVEKAVIHPIKPIFLYVENICSKRDDENKIVSNRTTSLTYCERKERYFLESVSQITPREGGRVKLLVTVYASYKTGTQL